MSARVTLRNYRCFDWNNPAVLEFRAGFTALIGTNNAGKSTALKAIYELRHMFPAIFGSVVAQNGFSVGVEPLGVADKSEIANDNDPERFQILVELLDAPTDIVPGTSVVSAIAVEYRIESSRIHSLWVESIDLSGQRMRREGLALTSVSNSQNGYQIAYQDGSILNYTRLAEFCGELNRSVFFPAFRNAINQGAGTYYDLPVGTALVSTWDEWKAGDRRSSKLAISRIEKEIAGLLGFDSLQINADKSGKTLDVIINGRPKKLYEVGAGIAQLIIVLAAALVAKPPYILIDEPELSLHPALQLQFLATLGTYADSGVLFATHSIGLARSAAERIFSVVRVKEGVSSIRPFGDERVNFPELLGELSFSSRIDLGCEAILLVEGPTEVLCFQELLRKAGKDKKYVLISLGGSSLIKGGAQREISEFLRIFPASNIYSIIDSERTGPDEVLAEDRASFVDLCRSLGISVHVTTRRATENYFDANAIEKALGPGFSALEPFQRLKDLPRPWKKSENWKIFRELDLDSLNGTDLRAFLDQL